jgi:hypothetical protein
MYKNGLTKSKYKESMRFFWTKRWKYERTPEDWVNHLNGEVIIGRHSFVTLTTLINNCKTLVWDAVDKLVLEKKFTKEEAVNIKKMLDAGKEDQYVALSIMAAVKPKKFKKII